MNITRWLVGISTALLVGQQSFAAELHKHSILLSRCEITYSYTAQALQLQNNIGGALAMLRRTTLMTTANFVLNEERGVIAGWKLQTFKDMRAPLKRAFDSGELSYMKEANSCDKNAIPIASAVRETRPILWGETFDALHDKFFQKMKTSLGL